MSVSKIYKSDKKANSAIDKLLQSEGIRRDKNLDYTCAIYDDDYNIIATGSCFGNTLRCMAVSHEHQGEGLMNEIVSHLIQYEFEHKIYNLFLYTKCNSAKFFGDLGFYEIARIDNQIVFMENRRNGFNDYLTELAKMKSKQAADFISAAFSRGAACCLAEHLPAGAEAPGPVIVVTDVQ